MKVLKVLNLAVVAAVLAFVLLPLAIIGGHAEEKPGFDMIGAGTAANNWLEKNTRKSLTRNWAYRLFGIPPSPSLYIGNDGWIFYTRSNNLDIAYGTYPLAKATLDLEADVFSNLRKYYGLMGAEFYFMSYPAKTSIYPEHVRDDLAAGISPSNIVVENLLAQTEVSAFTPKAALLEAKSNVRLYQKADSHTNDYGAYVVYKEICAEMAARSGIDMTPVDVAFIQGEYPCKFNDIAGVENIFGASETGPVAVYPAKARQVTDGKLFEIIEAICVKAEEQKGLTPGSSVRAIFENPYAPNGTLLLYGTSMFAYDNIGESYQLTRYLAENFRRVVYIGNNNVMMPYVDSLVQPDFVLYELPERNSDFADTRAGLIPRVAGAEDFEAIMPADRPNSVGNNGMWLESIGAQPLSSVPDAIEIGDSHSVTLSGWAEDANTQRPLSALYLRLGDRLFKCSYGQDRPGLSAELGWPSQADNAGFTIELPRVFFDGAVDMEFILIGTDGSYRYSPVVYRLNDSLRS